MPRFAAIEGLRAWLAWSVVAWHLVQATGLARDSGPMHLFEHVGDSAVLVFIAISGFVIAGLIVDKRERWPAYITRRAFRIFPAYLILLALALVLIPYGIAGALAAPWAGEGTYYWPGVLEQSRAMAADHPIDQLALQATLLQGLVPDSLRQGASTAILGPAWSLSLEWQFYLVAPMVVAGLMNPRWRLPLVAMIMLFAIVYEAGLLGRYTVPSVLPKAGYIFLIGIGCRLGFERLQRASLGPELVVVALAMCVLAPPLLWLGVWVAMIAYLARADAWGPGGGRHWLARLADRLLASPPAVYLGARSYSVYLAHIPMIYFCQWLLAPHAGLGVWPVRAALVGGVVIATLAASDFLYRLVERPMIRLGARIARGPVVAPAETPVPAGPEAPLT